MAGFNTAEGKAFLDRILAAVPEGPQREAVRADYSRLHDGIGTIESETARLAEVHRQQVAWHGTNHAALEDYNRMKAAGGGGGNPPVDQNKIEEAMQGLEDRVMSNGLALVTTASTIAASHLHEFKEPLDVRKLAQDAIKAKMTLDDYYSSTVATRRQERAEADLKARLDAAKLEGEKIGADRVRQEYGAANMPFPGRAGGPVATTTLSGLKKQDGAPSVLDAAVATANAVISAQSGQQ